MGFKTIIAPTVEPIPVADCRQHLRLDLDGDLASETDVDEAEDALILDKLGAAREYAEGVLGLYLAPRTVEITFERFPCRNWIELQGSPVRQIESVEYIDEDGAPVELDPLLYSFNDYVTPARLDLTYQSAWPEMRGGPNALRVMYVVGYGTISDSPPDTLQLPRDLRAALLLLLGHLYENREDSSAVALEKIPLGVHALLSLKRETLGV